MFQNLWSSEAQVEMRGFRVDVGSMHWPTPLETRICSDRHQLVMSLSPRPARSRVRYENVSPSDQYTDVGDVMFFAAGQTFQGRSAGGRQRLLTCDLAPNCMILAEVAGTLNERSLAAGLDIRDSRIRSSMARIAQETLSPGLGSKTLIEALLIASTVDLSRYLAPVRLGERKHRGGLGAWQIRRIRERVESEESSPSIAELAGLCGVSERHLMRGFKTMTGTTLYAYVSQARLEKAKRLLLETRLPLKTISSRLGFAQPSSFSGAFQRDMGINPAQFRAQSGVRGPE